MYCVPMTGEIVILFAVNQSIYIHKHMQKYYYIHIRWIALCRVVTSNRAGNTKDIYILVVVRTCTTCDLIVFYK